MAFPSQAAPTKPTQPLEAKEPKVSALKPTQPVEAKEPEAAAPKASKSKKKKKSRANKKSEEVATTVVKVKKTFVPEAESSDGEQSPTEIVKPMCLPAQPAKRKPPHRGPANYDLSDTTNSDKEVN